MIETFFINLLGPNLEVLAVALFTICCVFGITAAFIKIVNKLSENK